MSNVFEHLDIEFERINTIGTAEIVLLKGEKGDIGYPSDEQVAEAVDEWLDDHPEATTTVQDGTISIAKLATDTIELLDSKADLDVVEDVTMIQNNASGSIASFSDGADYPVKELIADINAVQDLHGYDAPWAGGAGKNLYNKDADYYGQGLIWSSTNGAPIESTEYYGSPKTPIKPETTYTRTSGTLANCFFDSSGNFLSTSYTGATFTSPANAYYVAFNIANSIDHATVQLEEGTSLSPYEPYSNICPISGWSAVNVNVDGINAWDEVWEVGGLANATGANWATSDRIRSKNYFPIAPNTQYYINVPNSNATLCYYDKDKNYISYEAHSEVTITTPANARYMRFATFTAYGTTYNNNISINYPSTDHDYHAYNGTTHNISLGQTVYGGKLNVTTGELVVTHICENIDGTEADSRYNFPAGSSVKVAGFSLSNSAVNDKGIFSKFKPVSKSYANFVLGDAEVYSNKMLFYYTGESTIAGAKAYIASIGGVQCCYELKTPTTVTLTPTEVKSLLGQNNIFADSGEVAVIYIANTKKYIDGTIVDVPLAMIAPIETGTTASKAYAVGDYFILNGNQFCKARTSIASGATFTLNTNYTVTTIGAELKALQ